MNVWKGELIAKVRLKHFFGPQTYIYYMDTNTDHFNPLTLRVRGKKAFQINAKIKQVGWTEH